METIYYGALEKSIELAKEKGTYNFYEGSDFSKGILQFDTWNYKPKMWDFDKLKIEMSKWGTRNSLLTALMPTASTSQILGNMECFETLTSNLYTRKTSVGVFKIINKYLINDLIKLGLWNIDMKNKIIINNGSIQDIKEIPQDLKDLYKTIWEIKQKWVIDHAIARSPFVDQSQSMNLYFSFPDVLKIKSALFYGWKKGLKTGCYYLRSQPASKPSNIINNEQNQENTCTMCSS
jgi:ribonucleotide reductase alpha subunit